ncbi:uncharacterized protein LOC106673435 [Cimex lectularius]|uniref:Uncharacterized protein n=1 Tax=Cimex lectularius TaxID=79782 RepID=A0A8I6SBR1_CIMLE|nr:uncharacterized protein LOC106673435 [Cimex lectularius]XP_014261026.1 uncharacterized protein LOC106673435 [Cimex lectularius]
MQLTFTQNESNVMVKCYAEGVYPEPNMTISAGDMEETRQIGIETSTKDGAYNISAVMTLSNEELKDPTTFDCVLRIPSANYTVRRTTVFYPAVTTTTTRAPLTTRNYRTTPRSEQISTATQRTHYLDPDLFSEGTSSYSEPTAKPAFAFIAGVLCFLLHRL